MNYYLKKIKRERERDFKYFKYLHRKLTFLPSFKVLTFLEITIFQFTVSNNIIVRSHYDNGFNKINSCRIVWSTYVRFHVYLCINYYLCILAFAYMHLKLFTQPLNDVPLMLLMHTIVLLYVSALSIALAKLDSI